MKPSTGERCLFDDVNNVVDALQSSQSSNKNDTHVIFPIPTDRRFKNLTGMTFDRLTVNSFAGQKKRVAHWNCTCICGTKLVVQGSKLGKGQSSCGCLKLELQTKHGHATNEARSDTYSIWSGMIGRCINKNHQAYYLYGAIGITVCDRWLGDRGFINFLSDVGQRPTKNHSIDRFPNNKGNYEPGNVRWATPKEQQRNRRDNRRVTHMGQTYTIADWSDILGVPVPTLLYRLKHHTPEEVFDMPYRRRKSCRK